MQKIVAKILVPLMTFMLLLSSCSEFVRVQKSTDANLKYSYAKKYYNMGKYTKAADLLEDVVPLFNGTSEGEQSLYLLANSYYMSKHPYTAAAYFKRYYTSYPKASMVEEARFKAGYGLYSISPDPRLDQSDTYEAIKELQGYIEFYPKGKYAKDAEQYLFELQDKLAYKQYLAADLYYNLGTFLGNNYRSCIVTAKDALKKFPYTKYREDFVFLILKAQYKEAVNSVNEKVQTRYREVLDQYYSYVNEYPNGKFLKRAKQIYESVSKHISKNL